jgi:hypothetical protein
MLWLTRKKPLKRSTKPIKRSRKRIAAKTTFRAHGANSTKTYSRKRTDAQVMAKAREYQAERKCDMPAAQIEFNAMLDDLGVLYESEAIVLNGDRFCLLDVLDRKNKIAWEIDGLQHETAQRGYDQGRDAWLLRKHGIRTIRITNEIIYKRPHEVRAIVLAAMG